MRPLKPYALIAQQKTFVKDLRKLDSKIQDHVKTAIKEINAVNIKEIDSLSEIRNCKTKEGRAQSRDMADTYSRAIQAYFPL